MARSSSPQLAKILERLELERPELVTIDSLATIAAEENIATSPAILALRLRKKGWLLPTGQRGVWEFAPAALAGAYSSMNPLLPLMAFSAAHPNLKPVLAMYAAVWALGLSDRVPISIDVALPEPIVGLSVPKELRIHTFVSVLQAKEVRGVAVLAPESLIVDMATFPSRVASWQSAEEWLPEVAYEMNLADTLDELAGRKTSVRARTGYLLQGVRPDISEAIMACGAPVSKVRFGPRTGSIRNDERWMIADTLLPFDPRDLERVR